MNNNLYYWTCDDSKASGEGRLAFFFKKKLQVNYNLIKINPEFLNGKNYFLKHKYIIPLVVIFFCWKFFFKKKKICYINYLPLWNFIIFLFLPPNTLLGPITGGAKFNKSNNILREYFFPILYFISEIIINLRNFKLIFATDLLKRFLNNKTITKSEFNFIINQFKLYNISQKIKKNDFIIYYRKHSNKESFFPLKFIKRLVMLNYKVIVIGDKLKIKGVNNKGFISNNKVDSLQKISKFTIASGENLYTLFTLECIQNNLKIIINKKYKKNILFFKKSFIKLNLTNLHEISQLKRN